MGSGEFPGPHGSTRATSDGQDRPRRGGPALIGAWAPSSPGDAQHGCRVLAQARVGFGHDGDFDNGIHPEHDLLDLLGADVLATADDDVGDPIGDAE